jgi:Glycosyl hydrolases family 43
MKLAMGFYLLFMLAAGGRHEKKHVGLESDPGYFLFSYFKDEHKGMYLAVSKDGFDWQEVNKGQPVISPLVGKDKLLRDPSINLGQDGIYRVVWTTGWKGNAIGYAWSSDLVHWSKEAALPVGEKLHGQNCWAPEIFYDQAKKRYMVYWSTQVGLWSSPKGKAAIYFVTTNDFILFSDPQVLFSNGLTAGGKAGDNGPIDAFIFKIRVRKYLLFYKKDDNTGIPNLFYRSGVSPSGPWESEQGPVRPSTGDEGPSCVKVGEEYRVYTDPFESDSAYVFVSKDLVNWERKLTNLKMSHGTVIKISDQVARTLMNADHQ